MRLDKYLKVSRLIKRRTVANEACDEACILVNGREQKAGYQVRQCFQGGCFRYVQGDSVRILCTTIPISRILTGNRMNSGDALHTQDLS